MQNPHSKFYIYSIQWRLQDFFISRGVNSVDVVGGIKSKIIIIIIFLYIQLSYYIK